MTTTDTPVLAYASLCCMCCRQYYYRHCYYHYTTTGTTTATDATITTITTTTTTDAPVHADKNGELAHANPSCMCCRWWRRRAKKMGLCCGLWWEILMIRTGDAELKFASVSLPLHRASRWWWRRW